MSDKKVKKEYPVKECSDCSAPVKKGTSAKYWHKKPLCSKCVQRLNCYCMTTTDYNKLLAKQGGVCAICMMPESVKSSATGETKELVVDHCHTFGTVRGLLCMKCNSALGMFLDSETILFSAILYLKRSRE